VHRKTIAEAHGIDLMQIAIALRLPEEAPDLATVGFAPKLVEISVHAATNSKNEFELI